LDGSDQVFAQALDAEDDAYLRAESRLRGSGHAILEPQLANPDPVGRLLAGVLLEWAETEDPGFDKALQYLDLVERRFAGTVIGVPPVGPVVDNLSTTFGNRLAEFLALRLVKVPTMAEWRARTTLTYLQQHPTPAVTDALLRYAATAPSPLQAAAVRGITLARDPILTSKIAAEQTRLAASGRSLPPAVAQLIG
jgi:hypothetical protein